MKKNKGFINPKLVKGIAFYIITACIVFSVVMCILAIWQYADPQIFWKTVSTLGVIGVGTAVFSYVNGVFGIGEDEN